MDVQSTRRGRTGAASARPLAAAVLLGAALLLSGCTIAAPVTGPGEPLAKVTPTPTPTATPTPEGPQPLAESAPLDLVITDIQIASTSNAGLFGAADTAVDDAAALAGVQAAEARLEGFLNAMFVQRATLLSADAVAALAPVAPLGEPEMLGLGLLPRDDVLGTVARSAQGTAQVQVTGSTVSTVTLFWSASVDLSLVEATGPVEQSGVAAFVDRGAGMQLVSVESRTTYGGDLTGVVQ